MYYQINKYNGKIEFVESSVMMVPEFKELINYFKNRNFVRLGWYYMEMIVLLGSSRSTYNRKMWTEEQQYERVIKASYDNMSREFTTLQIKGTKPTKFKMSDLRSPIFQNALKEFRDTEFDIVHMEFVGLEKQYAAYAKKVNEWVTSDTNTEDKLEALIKSGREIRKEYETVRKNLFERNREKDKESHAKSVTTHELYKRTA